jgi:hypothetical protein
MLNSKELKKYVRGLVLHWTAGNYSQTFDHYHYCITYDGKLAHVKETLPINQVGSHIYHRNTGLIGISMCGMVDIHHEIQDHQIEVTAKLVAELCYLFDWTVDDTYQAVYYNLVNGQLVNSGDYIKAPVVADHYYYAHIDHYPNDRWDIGDPTGKIKFNGKVIDLLSPIKRKAKWYLDQLKTGKQKREFTLSIT